MNFHIKGLYVIILLLSLSQFAIATSFDFGRTDGTGGQPFHVGYYGATKNMESLKVLNNNNVCAITCTYSTSQGMEDSVPAASGTYISAKTYSLIFAVPVVADGSNTLTTTITCYDQNSTFCTPSNFASLSKEVTLQWDSCGDSEIQSNYEICDGNSKGCTLIDSKYYSATAPCKSDCSGYDTSGCEYCGDGMINGAEVCDGSNSGGQTCQSRGYDGGSLSCSSGCNEISDSGCYKCGDGRIDSGENCNNCPADAGCGSGEGCNSVGQCINLGTDTNCGDVGDACIADVEHTGEYKCTTDYKGRYEILNEKGGECVNYQCTGSIQKNDEVESCRGVPCQDGKCGCLEGYSNKGGVCLKERSKNMNDPCDADFQCETDFCYNGKCSNAFLLEIKSEKEIANVGEEIDISISLTNTLDEDLQTQLILSAGSGVTVTRSDGAKVCTSSQCSTYDTITGKNSKDIQLRVEGRGAGEVQINGEIVFNYAGTKHSIPVNKKIVFTQCGDGVCDGDNGEIQQNCCSDCGTPPSTAVENYSCKNNVLKKTISQIVYLGIVGILAIGALGFFGIRYSKNRPKTKQIKKEREAVANSEKKPERPSKKPHEKDLADNIYWLIGDRDKGRGVSLARLIKELDMSGDMVVDTIDDMLESGKIRENKYHRFSTNERSSKDYKRKSKHRRRKSRRR